MERSATGSAALCRQRILPTGFVNKGSSQKVQATPLASGTSVAGCAGRRCTGNAKARINQASCGFPAEHRTIPKFVSAKKKPAYASFKNRFLTNR